MHDAALSLAEKKRYFREVIWLFKISRKTFQFYI